MATNFGFIHRTDGRRGTQVDSGAAGRANVAHTKLYIDLFLQWDELRYS